MNENIEMLSKVNEKVHEIDKRLALIELKIQTVEELKKTAKELQDAVAAIKLEYEKMKSYSKGRNKILGVWCAATGIVCTGLFMLGQVLLQKL